MRRYSTDPCRITRAVLSESIHLALHLICSSCLPYTDGETLAFIMNRLYFISQNLWGPAETHFHFLNFKLQVINLVPKNCDLCNNAIIFWGLSVCHRPGSQGTKLLTVVKYPHLSVFYGPGLWPIRNTRGCATWSCHPAMMVRLHYNPIVCRVICFKLHIISD